MPIDTHVHLAAADLQKYPHATERPFETESYVNPAERLLGLMDEARVDGAIIVQPFGIYGFDNTYHADAAAAHPDRFVGVCGLSAAQPDAPALLRHLVRERGMRGVRVILRGGPIEAPPDDPRFAALMAEAERLQVPVCFLTRARFFPAIGDLARRAPGLRIALDHLGLNLGGSAELPESLLDLAAFPNVFLKFSTPVFFRSPGLRDVFDRLLDRFGPDRLMWGSNYPPTDEGGYVNTVEISRRALSSLPEADRYALFTGTALRLWPQLRGATKRPEAP